MASADFFDVEVVGQGGHGAYPHLSMDPITARPASWLGLQNLVSREVAAYETAVLTVGQFVGGTKHNIIPASAVLRGSLRTFNAAVRAQIKQRLADYTADMARAYRTRAKLSFQGDGCPAVVNHEKETAFVRSCATAELGAAALNDGPPVMASDDMSLFLNARPGCYFRVGISPNDGKPHPTTLPNTR
jgi:amidohydrolase